LVSTFARRFVTFLPLPFPEALVLDPVFLRVDLVFDLDLGSGFKVVVDPESRLLAVVTKFLRTLNARHRLDKTARVGNFCAIGKIAERKRVRPNMNDNIVKMGT
jgi:hypothetical protein